MLSKKEDLIELARGYLKYRNEYAKLDYSMRQVEETNRKLNDEVRYLKNEVSERNRVISNIEEEKNSLKTEIENLIKSISRLSDEQRSGGVSEDEYGKLRSQNLELETKLSSITRDMDFAIRDKDSTIDLLNKTVQTQKEDIEELNRKVADLQYRLKVSSIETIDGDFDDDELLIV